MASFLKGKRGSIKKDLSGSIASDFFALDKFTRYGISSQISSLAYDPVQSLLAVGVNESKYGGGQIYIFGRKRVCATLSLPRKASIKSVHFCADKLLAINSRDEVLLYSLETRRLLASYAAPSSITAVTTDPSLDWAFLGLQTGEVIIYDLDRHVLAPLKLPNFWKHKFPNARVPPVVALALQPRDVGKLLIGYEDGAVVYSFKQNKTTIHLHYQIPPGAPGGRPDPHSLNQPRHPKLTHALWHPTGTFVLTGHEDSSIVIWDLKDGRVVMARTLQETNVDRPATGARSTMTLHSPLIQIAWCSKQNPDDTGLLVAGGASSELPLTTLTFLDLGVTPNYATSSWQALADHFTNPKRQHILPTPPEADIVSFCLVPRSSPHYAGSQDPLAILALLSSGEMMTLSFPTGHPISPANQLHVSLSFVHPFVQRVALAMIERPKWLGMKEVRQHGPLLLNGGAAATHTPKRYERRTVLQACHGDGTIRIWDAGHGDEIENEDVVQVDLGIALGRFHNLEVAAVSIAGETGEVAVGMRTGEVIIFKWGANEGHGYETPIGGNTSDGLSDISGRVEASLKVGLMPKTFFRSQNGPVTAIKMSNIGFVAVGFESGKIAVVDLRGPAVIFDAMVSALGKYNKRSNSTLHGHVDGRAAPELVTVIEYGIMSLEGDDYSSILCSIGTSLGRVITLKVLPSSNGRYSVQYAGLTLLEREVLMTTPLDVESGAYAYASQQAASGLGVGRVTTGVFVAVSSSGAKVFKPASSKVAHRTWEHMLCCSAAVVEFEGRDLVLVGLFGDGFSRAYSLPGLKEIAAARLDSCVDISRLSEALFASSGEIFAWTGPSELAAFHIWRTGKELPQAQDKLLNEEIIIPPRPTISNLQWISGSQYVSPADMDILIGGPDRPMSRRMMEQARAEEQQRRLEGRAGPSTTSGLRNQQQEKSGEGGSSTSEEGYWAYMQRQVAERTEKLGVVGESMDHLQEQSAGWAKDVGKYVNQQKKKVVLGAIGSKFGL